MSMAVGGKKGGAIADINVTPMADIMIVLLIIFMVITPMLQKGIDVKLPVAGNTKERKEEGKTITVAIRNDADKSTYLGGTKIDKPEDLVKQIKEKLEDLPDGGKIIYLKADEAMRDEARELAQQLDSENLRRQQEEADIVAAACMKAANRTDQAGRAVPAAEGPREDDDRRRRSCERCRVRLVRPESIGIRAPLEPDDLPFRRAGRQDRGARGDDQIGPLQRCSRHRRIGSTISARSIKAFADPR